MDYWIKGETFSVKEELKSWGCLWVEEKRLWKVTHTRPSDIVYKSLKQLGLELVPLELPPETQKIQD